MVINMNDKIKDKFLNELKDYNIKINKENNTIEIINNNGDNIFINIEEEITISFGNWHEHFIIEDNDIEEPIEKINYLINNKNCILNIYIDDKLFGCATSIEKESYTKEEDYWNSDMNYEL